MTPFALIFPSMGTAALPGTTVDLQSQDRGQEGPAPLADSASLRHLLTFACARFIGGRQPTKEVYPLFNSARPWVVRDSVEHNVQFGKRETYEKA